MPQGTTKQQQLRKKRNYIVNRKQDLCNRAEQKQQQKKQNTTARMKDIQRGYQRNNEEESTPMPDLLSLYFWELPYAFESAGDQASILFHQDSSDSLKNFLTQLLCRPVCLIEDPIVLRPLTLVSCRDGNLIRS